MIILGIESSCDETSIAVVKDGKEILSNNISSQIEIHKEYGGVVPEIASRQHIKNIATVLEESLEQAKITLDDVDYIAVTYAPGLIGALLVGISFAKGLSYAKQHSNYGAKKLSFIFYQMGVDREIVSEILEDEKDNQIEKIKQLWIKLGNKEYKKKVESILRKGFLYGDVKKAISSLEEEEE